jgi:uncharacterized membrane protein
LTRRSWIWAAVLFALCLSVVTNFFLVGYIAHGFREGAATRVLMNNVASAYSPEIRQEFRLVLRENRSRTLTVLRDLRAARAELTTATNASAFDEPAIQNAMQGVSKATANLQVTMQDYLLTALKRVQEKRKGEGA